MKTWLEAELDRVPPRGGLADAIRYALARWNALCRFLDDGRIELDTNTVERAIRPIALGRKNHLFAGSDGGADRWAIVCLAASPPQSSTTSSPSPTSRTSWNACPTAIR